MAALVARDASHEAIENRSHPPLHLIRFQDDLAIGATTQRMNSVDQRPMETFCAGVPWALRMLQDRPHPAPPAPPAGRRALDYTASTSSPRQKRKLRASIKASAMGLALRALGGPMAIIAIVEGQEHVRRRLARLVSADGLETSETDSALDALRAAFRQPPDAVIMGLTTAGLDGFELIRVLRATCDTSILVVTSTQNPLEVAKALDAGADDVARLRGAMRRHARRQRGVAETRVATGALVVDLEARLVQKRGQVIPLTRIEYRLLSALATHLGETVTHRDLLTETWGPQYADDTHYLRLYVAYLRAKLEDNASRPTYILNEWGMGYRLVRLPVEQAEQLAMPTEDSVPSEDLILAAG
jgi:two-component system, OmpR family, KDP operon response regulator KdpE